MPPENNQLEKLKTMFESETWQSFSAKNLCDVVWLADLDLNYIYLSPSAQRLSGFSHEELANLTAGDILTPVSMEKAMAIFAEELAIEETGRADAERSRIIEVEQVCKDGSIVWVELNISFVRDDSGKPIGFFGVTRDIDGRKKTEEALRAEQQEKEQILNNLAEEVTYLDSELRIMWVNAEVIKRRNLAQVMYKGKKCYELYHGLKQPCPDCYALVALEAGETAAGIYQDPDNSYLKMTCVPVRGQKGEIIGVINTVLDITAAEALKVNNILLRIAGDTAKFGGWNFDLTTNRVIWSDQVAEIHKMPIGYAPLVEEGISFYAPEWRDKIAAVFTACVEDGIAYDEEMEIINAQGNRVWVRTTGEAVRDESGKIFKIQGSFQDISERKKIEKRIQKQYDLIQGYLDTTATIMVSLDTDGKISMLNRYGLQLLEYNEKDVIGKKWFNIALPQPEGMAKVFPVYQQIMSGNLEEVRHFENDVISASGKRYTIAWRNNHLLNDEGEVIGTLSSGIDITERKEAENTIRKLNEELEQRVKERTIQLEAVNKELESFAYSVSHDLRAPLRALDGYCENLILKYEDKLDDKGRHYLGRIQKAALDMSKLIDDLLRLSRVTRVGLKKQQVDISKLSAEIIASLQEAELQRKAEVEISPNLVAHGDLPLLRVVMENLLGNAWKFSSQEATTKIAIGQAKIDGEEIFFVRDNGVGINMAYADKLFGAFQRLHAAAEFPGTGIGLATVQRIINRHGGKVWVESKVGKGSTFYFTLSG